MGDDPLTGRNYDHRKDWIEDKLQQLAAQMAVEVLGYSIMSNHLHAVLRIRPDVALRWSDEEVARRWWNLCPQRKDKKGRPQVPTRRELDAMMADATRLAIWRGRLSSISWAMRLLSEPIARRANREDDCTGRFWEGRFKCQRLLDEGSLLACCLYVDLNPIRAGLAETPETSRFTAAYLRIQAEVRPETGSDRAAHDPSRDTSSAADDWLSPIYLDERRDERQDPQPARRASNRGFLPLTRRDYLEILDWTGRQLRGGTPGKIPDHLAPILERLGLVPRSWLATVENFGRWFHRAIGAASAMSAEATARGQKWLVGIRHCRTSFQ